MDVVEQKCGVFYQQYYYQRGVYIDVRRNDW